MNNIHRLAKMFQELAEHNSKITGEQARRINDYVMFNPGMDGIQAALEKEGLKLGPAEDKETYFILDPNGEFIVNGFVNRIFDHGSNMDVFKVSAKDMRGLIKDYEVGHDDDKKKEFMNTMEAYKRWDDGLE